MIHRKCVYSTAVILKIAGFLAHNKSEILLKKQKRISVSTGSAH